MILLSTVKSMVGGLVILVVVLLAHSNHAWAHELHESEPFLDLVLSIDLLNFNNRQLIPILDTAETENESGLLLPAINNFLTVPQPPKPEIHPKPEHTLGLNSQDLQIMARVPVDQPVVFLTIDDGVIKNQAAVDYMIQHQLVASLFLNDKVIKDNYDYFRQLTDHGSIVENHTLNHPNLKKLNLDQQMAEICGDSDRLTDVFGHRPTLFRPPYGFYNSTTLEAVKNCGLQAIIYWSARVQDNKLEFQNESVLRPGDIVLTHFKDTLASDLEIFYNAVNNAHLQVGLLEDWLP